MHDWGLDRFPPSFSQPLDSTLLIFTITTLALPLQPALHLVVTINCPKEQKARDLGQGKGTFRGYFRHRLAEMNGLLWPTLSKNPRTIVATHDYFEAIQGD